MKKPVLVIMAAGMGSRYGGLKQIDPVDPEGHIIMDFSLYDAKKAGFEEVIFIIKKENEKDFKETIGNRISKIMKVSYVFQELTNLPEGYRVPEGRVKPWGTVIPFKPLFGHTTGRQSKTMGNRSCSAELSGNSGCTVCSYQCG